MLITDIRTDGATQSRESLDVATVAEYADAMANGAAFPAVVVFYDGQSYWLADGFHRVAAAKQSGMAEIDADVRQGSRRDAILLSVGANSSHGLRRTNADKRRAVMTLLNDEEWSRWSDREIARRCVVSHVTVKNYRDEISLLKINSDEPRTYTTKHGTTATMNTANIGRTPAPSPAPTRPAAWQPPPAPQVEEDDWADDGWNTPTATTTAVPATPQVRQPVWSEGQRQRKALAEKGITVVASKRAGPDGLEMDHALINWAKSQGIMVEIGRNTKWGNPFEMPADGDRNAVCDHYANQYMPYKPSLTGRIAELRGKVLVCWCHPERCHGDHLAELANQEKANDH
jgi:hypothetical protein